MRISYLPQIVSPQKNDTFIPFVYQNTTWLAKIGELDITGVQPGVSQISAGQNIYIDPPDATSTATVSFNFPGAIFPFPTDQPPAGWLFCRGQNISRNIYSRLFSVIGISYGSGDGRLTFGLPDLRGRVIAGVESMGGSVASGRITASVAGNVQPLLGVKGGVESTALNTDQVPTLSHTHTISSITSGFVNGRNEGGNRCNGNDDQQRGRLDGSEAVNFNFNLTYSSAENTATEHSNIPPLAFFYWAIKY
jgi:microcystin-dependent protein